MPVWPRHRLWIEALSAGRLVLTGERAHYLRHVLRLMVRDRVTVVGGDGRMAVGELVALRQEQVELELSEPVVAPTVAMSLTVGVAAPKGERADWLVEKLTELGVARISWLHTERTVVLPKAGARASRWQRLAEAAAKQATRASVPFIDGPHALDVWLQHRATKRYIGDARGVCLIDELTAGAVPADAVLLIGPEGGFTPDELSRAYESGYTPVSLGVHRLRVETAAVVGAAMILGRATSASVVKGS